MRNLDKFYINGTWTPASSEKSIDVINPATETPCAKVSLGSEKDVDRAVAAAKKAFPGYAQTTINDRKEILGNIMHCYLERLPELASVISQEMGAPMGLAVQAHAPSGLAHFQKTIECLDQIEFEAQAGGHTILKEPIGVCGLITPWNWPINQIACKVAPALAAGCTMVLKPSEIAPGCAQILAEIIDKAGIPDGVFNLVHGDGPTVGAAISAHADIDFVSFTGSTRAGIEVAKAAASSVKRVTQELGGKSANIILDGADIESAVTHGVIACMTNSGQSCNAPTRMLVPAGQLDKISQIAINAVATITVGDPNAENTTMGPLSSLQQYNKVQSLIKKGIDDGAVVAAGGLGKPDGLNQGYYAKPTIFTNATNTMSIAREEIFGPVLTIIPYADEDEAIEIANDTPYGLSGYVSAASVEQATNVAKKLRTGNIHLNSAGVDFAAPFGGYKQSGNGREWGAAGLEEFLEVKAIMMPGDQ